MKTRLILLCFLGSCFLLIAHAAVIRVKPKIKTLDMTFSCDARVMKTIDDCYYSGIQELNAMGCHLQGAVSSANCDASEDRVNVDTGETHVQKEWVCSVPSTNCKETFEKPCPLDYRKINRFEDAVHPRGKVFLDFLDYCVYDAQNGRKDSTQILQNAPLNGR